MTLDPKSRKPASKFALGFVVGLVVPFLLSAYTVVVLFPIGSRLATFLAPSMLAADKLSNDIILVINGTLYGLIFLGLSIAFKVIRRRGTNRR